MTQTPTHTLPVMPLRDVVLYPHMVSPLFVGREKSIHALDAAMKSDPRRILVVAQKQPDIDEILNSCRVRYGLAFDLMDTSFFLSRETVIPTAEVPGMAFWRDHLFAWMTRNATRATEFFNIPANRVVELGTHIEI